MNWEDKTELIRLSNVCYNSHSTISDHRKFFKFILRHIAEFNEHDWHFFYDVIINCIDLDPEETQKHLNQWKEVWTYVQKLDTDKCHLATAWRIVQLKDICIVILRLN